MEVPKQIFQSNGNNMTFDPSKVSLADVDPVSGIPYLHESFVLHTFVPIRYVRRQKPFDESTFTGMYPEGFRIPTILTKHSNGEVVKYTKFDDEVICMMVGNEIVGPGEEENSKVDCITNHMFTRPGFLNLNPKGAARHVKSAPAITRERTKTMLQSEVSLRGTSSRTYLHTQNKLHEEGEIAETNESFTPRASSAAPANKAKRKKLPDNVEYSLALKHPSWPEVASEWVTRGRNVGWPGRRIEKKILLKGCHVTPGAHPKSEDPDLEWEYTFFEAERILNKEAVSSSQRQCFILFCLLCVDSLEKKSLSLQQMKSVFYFVCETTDPQIWRNNKAVCVNVLLDFLLDCIRNANLPEYFIPKNNTLSHLLKDDLIKLEEEVSSVRINPAKSLINKTGNCAFINIFPFYCNVSELYAPFMANAKDFAKKKEIDKAVRALLTFTDEMCNSFYLDTGFQIYEETYEEISVYVSSLIAHGVSGFEEAIEYFVKPLQGDREAQKHLQFLPQLLSQKNITLSEKLPPFEIWRPIRMCRLLIQKFADGKTGSHLFDHLGCMYHSASMVYSENSQETLQKAEAAFKDALEREDCGVGTYVDYGRFLCRTKRYDDSVLVLRKIILKEFKRPESINFYGRMEALVADEFIKREIEATDGLEILSCAFAYYLMCECFTMSKKKPDLLKTLKQFEDFCNLTKDPQSLSLLGYSFMRVHQFRKALAIFQKVKEVQPLNKMVTTNIAYCEKHQSNDVCDENLNLEKTLTKLSL